MLQYAYDVLDFIYKNPGCSWYQVMNSFDPELRCRDTDAVLKYFIDQGMIEPKPRADLYSSALYLTPSAVVSLLSEKQAREDVAARARNERKQHVHDHIFTGVITIVAALVGGLLTMLQNII